MEAAARALGQAGERRQEHDVVGGSWSMLAAASPARYVRTADIARRRRPTLVRHPAAPARPDGMGAVAMRRGAPLRRRLRPARLHAVPYNDPPERTNASATPYL